MASRNLVPTFIMKTYEMLEVFCSSLPGLKHFGDSFLDWTRAELRGEKLTIAAAKGSTALLQAQELFQFFKVRQAYK